MPCRLNRSSEWATRLYHEAQCHEESAFVTLTYSDENLPLDYSVSTRELQLFFKRLRKGTGVKLRYLACAEYGDIGLRPHYHAVIFGLAFADRTPWRQTSTGFVTYRSAQLEKYWTLGHSEIGSVTPQSAGYVARYVTKKVTGDLAQQHYTRMHPITGEIVRVAPEFLLCSTRPGLGMPWLDKYKGDIYPSDFVVVNGTKKPVPKYYTKKLNEREALTVKAARKAAALEKPAQSDWRLPVIEECTETRLTLLKRELETDQ